MSKKLELKDEIFKIWKIYQLSKEAFLYSWYLHKPKTQEELEYINSIHFLDFTRHTLWRISVIELCKLFLDSDKEDFNLYKFIRKLKPGNYFGSLKFDEVLLKEWEDKINCLKDSIEYLRNLRHEIYSHTDRERSDLKGKEKSFEEISELFTITGEIISKVNEFNGEFDLSSPELDINEFNLIKKWSDSFNEKIEKDLEEYRKSKKGTKGKQ